MLCVHIHYCNMLWIFSASFSTQPNIFQFKKCLFLLSNGIFRFILSSLFLRSSDPFGEVKEHFLRFSQSE